jgi:predicted phosphate transport protein (TIGR00153 family)
MAFSLNKLFSPKDRVFYGLFEQSTNNLVEMGQAFVAALRDPDRTKRDMALRGLDDLEHKNDEVTHQIFIELGRNFITPFDREDIHTLATALDDVADYIWGSAKRVVYYNIAEIDETMHRMADVILESIVTLQIGVRELRNMKNLKAITDSCVKVNSLENDADELLDAAIVRLFDGSQNIDAIELIKRKDLYEEMETVTDKCEDAANVIESIILKPRGRKHSP